MSELNPGRDRNGPHRGTIEIIGADTLADAEERAAAWISEFLDGHGFVFASQSTPTIINLGDGQMRVAGWDVTIDWRAVG